MSAEVYYYCCYFIYLFIFSLLLYDHNPIPHYLSILNESRLCDGVEQDTPGTPTKSVP